jgi:hypothetical protein
LGLHGVLIGSDAVSAADLSTFEQHRLAQRAATASFEEKTSALVLGLSTAAAAASNGGGGGRGAEASNGSQSDNGDASDAGNGVDGAAVAKTESNVSSSAYQSPVASPRRNVFAPATAPNKPPTAPILSFKYVPLLCYPGEKIQLLKKIPHSQQQQTVAY